MSISGRIVEPPADGQSTCASRSVIICNKKGLHARAAAKFVKTAQLFKSSIRVKRALEPSQGELLQSEDQEVSARSILGLMMLGAAIGTPLLITAQGADAAEALDALEALILARFEENE